MLLINVTSYSLLTPPPRDPIIMGEKLEAQAKSKASGVKENSFWSLITRGLTGHTHIEYRGKKPVIIKINEFIFWIIYTRVFMKILLS